MRHRARQVDTGGRGSTAKRRGGAHAHRPQTSPLDVARRPAAGGACRGPRHGTRRGGAAGRHRVRHADGLLRPDAAHRRALLAGRQGVRRREVGPGEGLRLDERHDRDDRDRHQAGRPLVLGPRPPRDGARPRLPGEPLRLPPLRLGPLRLRRHVPDAAGRHHRRLSRRRSSRPHPGRRNQQPRDHPGPPRRQLLPAVPVPLGGERRVRSRGCPLRHLRRRRVLQHGRLRSARRKPRRHPDPGQSVSGPSDRGRRRPQPGHPHER